MSSPNKLQDGFHGRPLNDGNVEFQCVKGGKQLVAGSMTPEQVSSFVTQLLGSSFDAFNYDDKPPKAADLEFQGSVVHTTRVFVGVSDQGQQVIVAEAGKSAIAFAIPHEDLRPLARCMIEASHNANVSHRILRLLNETFLDLTVRVSGIAKVVKKIFMLRGATGPVHFYLGYQGAH